MNRIVPTIEQFVRFALKFFIFASRGRST